MCIPQIAAIRNNLVSTDKSAFVDTPVLQENLCFNNKSGVVGKSGFTDNLDFTDYSGFIDNSDFTDNSRFTDVLGFTDNSGCADDLGFPDNSGFTDDMGFTENSGFTDVLGFSDNSGFTDDLGFTDKSGFTDNLGISANVVKLFRSTSKNAEKHDDPSVNLRHYKLNSINKVVFAHININSIRNKFEDFKEIVQKNIDILTISETKLDESFPTNQFNMDGYVPPFRLDRSSEGGGLLIYIRDDIPAKKFKNHPLPKCCEGIFIEIKLRNTNWLVFSGYNPYKRNISTFLKDIEKSLNKYLSKYDNIILLGDFNSEISETAMSDFCDIYNLENLVNKATCFKNPTNPSCIDIILTNRENSFQKTKIIETGISDHHSMTVTTLKTCLKKKSPKIITYRNYKSINTTTFKNELDTELKNINISNKHITYDLFKKCFMSIVNKHAPLKKRLIRANNAPFMNKNLSKSIKVQTKK